MAWLRLALFVSLVICCAFANVSKEDGVDVLTVDNFDTWLLLKEHALVEFYAPWCGHCKHLAPEYAAAATALADSGSTVALGKVDVTENEALGEKYSIQGFPTLIWFENGERVNYDGGRTKDTILSWIKRQTLADLPVIKSAQDFEKAKASGPIVVHYGTSSRAGDLLSLAKKDGDINGYYVTDESLFDGQTDGDIVIFSAYAEKPIVVRAAEDLYQVIRDNIYPAYAEFSNEQFGRLAKDGWVLVAVGPFTEPEKAELESIVSKVTGLGAGVLYGDSHMLGRAIAGVGASGEVFPTAVIINPSEQKQFAFNEEIEFNAETLKEFVVSAVDGTIKPYRKSEPLPENGDSGVVTLVAKNFDDYINVGTPAFVKYYAPWCGHCKTLAPVWDELAEAIPRSSVIIAKLDATANYVEEVIQGYPTLIWYNADGTKEDYNGGRDLASLTAFVNSKISGDDHAHSHEEL